MSVRFGIDSIITDLPALLRRGRVGMITSNVATTAVDAVASRQALREAGADLVRLFGPEHGLRGTADDGAKVPDDLDPLTGLPVVSLYGQSLRPPREAIEDLDALIYDIPDVGARFYTYIWTLSHVMEAAAESGVPLYVLDRPNPLGGDLAAVEGPMLDEAVLSSFVGRWNIPVRYSLTIGELARLWNAERDINCELHVIPCAGWRRDMHWPDTAVTFRKMSPAMPSYQAALFYPGTCLIEGTKLSEGRGTAAPFQIIGAPWVQAGALAETLNALRLPGLHVEPIKFVPEGRKYAGQGCRGVRLRATNARSLRPVAVGLHVIAALIRLHQQEFEWLPYPTAANEAGHQHFDRLVGRLDVRSMLDNGEQRIDRWTAAPDWTRRVQPYLLYP